MRVTKRKTTGPPPFPRRRLNPKLYPAVRACRRPRWMLAVQAGFTHDKKLSALVCADSVIATPLTIERLERLADLVGFDRAALFVDTEAPR